MDHLLSQFLAESDSGPLGVPWSDHSSGDSEHSFHVVLGFLVHGNEWGTLPAALRLAKELRSGELKTGGPLTIVLGNPDAAGRGERFVDEDLNRVFTFDGKGNGRERRRAAELRPLLDSADLFLDFHQTQTPTESSFWTFPWDVELANWARVIGAAPFALTRAPGTTFSKGTCCLDEYVRNRGRIGITVEMGTKGEDPAQVEETYRAARRLIASVDEIQRGAVSLETLATRSSALDWFQTSQVVTPLSSKERLRPGLGNWTRVVEGELLNAPGTPEIRAGVEGRVLFPKYPRQGDPVPGELLRLGVRIENPFRYFEK